MVRTRRLIAAHLHGASRVSDSRRAGVPLPGAAAGRDGYARAMRMSRRSSRSRRRRSAFLAATSVIALSLGLPAAETRAASLPPAAVATVGGQPVTKVKFDYWLAIAARGARIDPPRFGRCIAVERRRARRRGRNPSRRGLRSKCGGRYAATRADVTKFLIEELWIRQEAASRGLSLGPGEIRREFQRQRRSAFSNRREYRRFLRESGQKEADILLRVELDLLQTRLSELVARSAAPVTSEDVSRYYAKHRHRFRKLRRPLARRMIRRLLRARREVRALDRFSEDFRRRSKAKTICMPRYVVTECGSTSELAG